MIRWLASAAVRLRTPAMRLRAPQKPATIPPCLTAPQCNCGHHTVRGGAEHGGVQERRSNRSGGRSNIRR
eukprot:2783028-Pyramimonas_sp.AAC.1